MARRPPVTPRRAATRRRLLDAALLVVAKRGFHGASVDEIAGKAGLSVGALYSNFSSKDDLFFAIFDEHLTWFDDRVRALATSDTQADDIASWLAYPPEEANQMLLFLEFWAYAVRQPKLRKKMAAQMHQLRESMTEAIRQHAHAAGAELPLPADVAALLMMALGRGLALERLADENAVDPDQIARLIVVMLGVPRP